MLLALDILRTRDEGVAKTSVGHAERSAVSALFRRHQHPLCQLPRQFELPAPIGG